MKKALFLIAISFLLGGCIGSNSGTESMPEATKECLKKAEDGDAVAQYEMTLCYLRGINVPVDTTKAMNWAKISSKQGFPEATYFMAERYKEVEDKEAAKEWYTNAHKQANPLAVKGDARAQYVMGLLYYYGDGDIYMNKTTALTWFKKSASQGYMRAQYKLGDWYEHGQGITKNDSLAAEWYRKAAEQGFALAQLRLGSCYHSGKVMAKNDSLAAVWWRKAAEQNYAEAQYMLGCSYYDQDREQAVYWWRKAAEQDYAEAQYILGCSYYGQDRERAEYWWSKAAEKGFRPRKDDDWHDRGFKENGQSRPIQPHDPGHWDIYMSTYFKEQRKHH